MNVLHICANPKPTEDSASKQLATAFFGKMIEVNPDIEILNVDLYSDPPPFLTYEAIRGFWFPITINGYTATREETNAMEYGIKQARLFNTADVVVLTLPMWNFTIPAILKAWMDQIITPGSTFSISKENGVKPLHRVQKLILLVSSGGIYKESDPRDALTNQVEHIFSWIGINDIGIAWADGQDECLYTDGAEHKAVAKEAALELAEEVGEMAAAVG